MEDLGKKDAALLVTYVIAFERGECVEDGSPAELLLSPGSQLHFLFEQARDLIVSIPGAKQWRFDGV